MRITKGMTVDGFRKLRLLDIRVGGLDKFSKMNREHLRPLFEGVELPDNAMMAWGNYDTMVGSADGMRALRYAHRIYDRVTDATKEFALEYGAAIELAVQQHQSRHKRPKPSIPQAQHGDVGGLQKFRIPQAVYPVFVLVYPDIGHGYVIGDPVELTFAHGQCPPTLQSIALGGVHGDKSIQLLCEVAIEEAMTPTILEERTKVCVQCFEACGLISRKIKEHAMERYRQIECEKFDG